VAEDGSAGDDDGGADYRQVSFVVVALLGLAVAAFVAPPQLGQPGSDGGDQAEPSGGGGSGGGLLRYLFRIFEFFVQPDGGGGEPACTILLNPDPVPGREVTVTVRDDGRPVPDAVVWFDDERIGRTDEDGQVTGEVPYSRELDIRVSGPSLSGCRATTGTERFRSSATPETRADPDTGGSTPDGSIVTSSAPVGASAPAAPATLGLTRGASAPPAERVTAQDNGSATYRVRGDVVFEVFGLPYPGETVTLDARIRGIPVPRAAVEIDGEQVATTDENGSVTIEIPRKDEIDLTVSRGDFSSTQTIDVLLLEPTLRPERLLLVPEGEATVVANRADERVSGAVVRIDGEVVGTTDERGEAPIGLPRDPTTPVSVETERGQTASVSLFELYWLPTLLLLGLVTVSSAGAYHRRGARAAGAVVSVFAAGLGTLLVDAYLGRTAGLVTAGGFVAVLLGAALYYWRQPVSKGTTSVTAVFEWLVTTALRLVGNIERLLDALARGVDRLATWLRSLPRSVSGILRRLLEGTKALLVRIAAAIRRPRISVTTAGLVLVAAIALVGGYAIRGVRGIGIAAVAVVLGSLAWWYVSGDDADPAGSTPAENGTGPTGTVSTGAGTDRSGPTTLRQLWRAFARRVLPGRWRTRSAAEIGRAAVRQGYPDRPVRELTTTFREVEYGNRSLSDAVDERARRAYRAIVDEDEEEPIDTSAEKPTGDPEEKDEGPTVDSGEETGSVERASGGEQT